jgi:ammonium transporter, Amt family
LELQDFKIAIDSSWVALSAALVFFMTIGFALLESGSVRSKNVSNSLIKNFLIYALCLILYWAIGFAIEFGDGQLIGTQGFFLLGTDNSPAIGDKYFGVYKSLSGLSIPLPLKFLFQAGFASVAIAIVSGAIAERMTLKAFMLFTALFMPLGYAIAAHWVWGGGWLFKLGFFDFAGSALVHGVGGMAALTGAWIVGSRANYNAVPLLGHSANSRAIGCGILWLGWWGFNGGSVGAMSPAVGHVLLTTNLAAAAGGLTAIIYSWRRYDSPDLNSLIDGILGGLVAITASCAYVAPWASIAIGAIAGVIVMWATAFLQEQGIDDPAHAIGVHLFCGSWGTIALGLFSQGNAFGSDPAPALGLLVGGTGQQLGIQVAGLLSILLFSASISYVIWSALRLVGLRVSPKAEKNGIDRSTHREVAYPIDRDGEHE